MSSFSEVPSSLLTARGWSVALAIIKTDGLVMHWLMTSTVAESRLRSLKFNLLDFRQNDQFFVVIAKLMTAVIQFAMGLDEELKGNQIQYSHIKKFKFVRLQIDPYPFPITPVRYKLQEFYRYRMTELTIIRTAVFAAQGALSSPTNQSSRLKAKYHQLLNASMQV